MFAMLPKIVSSVDVSVPELSTPPPVVVTEFAEKVSSLLVTMPEFSRPPPLVAALPVMTSLANASNWAL